MINVKCFGRFLIVVVGDGILDDMFFIQVIVNYVVSFKNNKVFFF